MITSLHVAIKEEDFKTFSNLIIMGVDINQSNSDLDSPLHLAIKMKNTDMLKILLNRGANIYSNGSPSPDYYEDNYNQTNTPLLEAIKSNDVEILKLFLNVIYDLNSRDRYREFTLLHQVVRWGNSKTVKLLIDAGANVNVSDYHGITPLHVAVAKTDNYRIVKTLIDSNAYVNVSDVEGYSPVHFAVKSNNTSILKLLLDSGVNPNARNYRGNYTPLHLTNCFTNEDILNLLIKAGADVNNIDNNGETPFMILARLLVYRENAEYINSVVRKLKLLIEYTDVNLTTDRGSHVLAYCLESNFLASGRKFFFQIILEHVAIVSALDLPVASRLIHAIFNKNVFSKYFSACIDELDKAKNTKLHNCWVRFLDLLINDKSKLVKYAGNQDLVNDFMKNVDKFPIYGVMMKKNVYEGINERKLYDKAADNLSYYCPIFNPTHLILRNILDILNEESWRKLSA